jgi:hypothetical protein
MFLSDAIREKTIHGPFKKFIYRCGGFFRVVYCRNETDFLKLISQWNLQSEQFCHSKFFYTAESRDGGTPMSLTEIASELFIKEFSTEGSCLLKSILIDPYTHVEYIQ